MKNLTPENITISFTSYNILEYLQLAIYTFLEYYPNYKKSIIVFDDDSTDGTKEWLKKEGIKRTTWSKDTGVIIRDFSKLRTIFSPYTGVSASYRNSVMLKQIFERTKTKYLSINDADVLFFKGGWLEKYDEMVDDYKVFAPFETYYYGNPNFESKIGYEEFLEKNLGKYKDVAFFIDGEKKWGERLHFFHAVLDLDYLKQRNVLFDDINDKRFIALVKNNATLDTGSDFYYKIIRKKIPYYIIEDVHNNIDFRHIELYQPMTDKIMEEVYIYHFRWIASYRRDIEKDKAIINVQWSEKMNRDLRCQKLLKYIKYIHEKYNTRKPEECLKY